MRHAKRLLAKVRGLLYREDAEKELGREVASHLTLLEDDYQRRGMTAPEARFAALRAYGSVAFATEMHRDERSLVWLEQLLQDFRYALRSLAKSRGFVAVAILTLALGIGANAAIFSIVNVLLLHPLPYAESERLVSLGANNLAPGVTSVSFTKFRQVQEEGRTLESVAAFDPATLAITTSGTPEQIPGARVSADFFRVLGVAPAAGRGFAPEENREGGSDAAVISDAFWHNHFGGTLEAIGQTIAIDGKPTTIVGVLPAGFRFPLSQPETGIYLPRVFDEPNYTQELIHKGASYLFLIGRVAAGQPMARVQAEMDTICSRYRQAFPRFGDANAGLTVTNLDSTLVANLKPSLLALLVAAGFVLLIACVNVASLLLARSASRQKEIAVRTALGASRTRLIRQFLTESVILSFVGGGWGVALAYWGLPVLVHLIKPGTLPLTERMQVDRAVLLFSLVTSSLTGLAAGLLPAVQAATHSPQEKLREGARGSTGGGGRARRIMVVAEVALALVLMTGAGLLLKSLVNLMHVSPGFASDHIMTFPFSLPKARYPQPLQRTRFYQSFVDRVRGLPGVESAAMVSHLPLGGSGRFIFVCPEGRVCQGIGKDPMAAWRQVSPDFFSLMRVRMLRGRAFTERDTQDSPRVAVINQTIADRYFPGANPIGRHIANSRDMVPMEIVGVAKDLKYSALNAPDTEEIYVPYTQGAWPSATLLVRYRSNPQSVVSAVRQSSRELDSDLPFADIRSMEDVLASSFSQPQLIAGLVGAFAGCALLLATVGIYGVMAFLVTQRSQEMAIRMALGAQRASIFQLVVGQGLRLVLIGVAIGLAASVALTRLLTTLLFGTSATDTMTLGGVSLLFALVALCACYVPARRATRLDALEALRCQ